MVYNKHMSGLYYLFKTDNFFQKFFLLQIYTKLPVSPNKNCPDLLNPGTPCKPDGCYSGP